MYVCMYVCICMLYVCMYVLAGFWLESRDRGVEINWFLGDKHYSNTHTHTHCSLWLMIWTQTPFKSVSPAQFRAHVFTDRMS